MKHTTTSSSSMTSIIHSTKNKLSFIKGRSSFLTVLCMIPSLRSAIAYSILTSTCTSNHIRNNNYNSNDNDVAMRVIGRSKFLSASAATFLTSAIVMATDPEACEASPSSRDVVVGKNNPRYIDQELEMTYGEGKDGNPRSRGVLVRRLTGDSTPYSFPVKPVSLVKEWPADPPFRPEDFLRSDGNDDSWFYTVPRLVYHIDEPAVASLTQYYRSNIPKGSSILDICSSWVSHYPLEFPKTMKKICATGMSGLELQFNDQLTGGYVQKDLNVDPKLPYDDNTFDVVTCVVSIDYLIEPIKVLKEVHRVLKPGGKMIVSQSNRCFPSKAIAMVSPHIDTFGDVTTFSVYYDFYDGFVGFCLTLFI